MFWSIILHIFVTNLLIVTFSQYIDGCYLVSGVDKQKIWVSFPTSVSFIPKYLMAEFFAKDRRYEEENLTPRIRMHAKLLNESCPYAPFIFPHMMVHKDEKSYIELGLYYHNEGGPKIDKFIAYAWKDFDPVTVTLRGLNMDSRIRMRFSRDHKMFPYFDAADFKYFGIVPPLGTSESMCLTIFKTGTPIVLKVASPLFKTRNIFDHYMVEFHGMINDDGITYSDLYFAKSHVCDGFTKLSPALIYTDPSIKKVQIRICDKTHNYLVATYEKNSNEYLYDKESSTLAVEPVKITPLKAELASAHLKDVLLYPTDKKKAMCHKRDPFSFVQLIKSSNAIIQKKGVFADDSDISHKIMKMRQGTQEEIDKCLRDIEH